MLDPPSRYVSFDRESWASLRAATPLTLDEEELVSLRGINEHLDLTEVTDVYLPLSRLLNLHVAAIQQLGEVTATFVGVAAITNSGYAILAGTVRARLRNPAVLRWINRVGGGFMIGAGALTATMRRVD